MSTERVRSSEGEGFRLVILALFFLSGACGLVYEVVWMRMLTLVFGATSFATCTILSAFFSGLALGSFLFGRVIDGGVRRVGDPGIGRSTDGERNPLVVYALLEGGIGLFAFLMPLLLSGLTAVYLGLSRWMEIPFYQFSLIRFVLSFLVLLVPATLMGGTLPVILKFFARNRGSLGLEVGKLYAVNTFGAVVGTVAAGFFLILFLGVNETAYAAGAVNLLIAGVVLVLGRRWAPASEPEGQGSAGANPVSRTGRPPGQGMEPIAPPAPAGGASAGSGAEGGAGAGYPPRLLRLALWAAAVSGFCALALEVLWTRALVFFLDNSTHAFSTMLTAFLLGIALGSALLARFIDTRRRLLAWLGVLQLLVGFFAVLAIPVLGHLSPVIQAVAGTGSDATLFWRWSGMRFLTSLAVMLVPTLLMGASFPLVTRIYGEGQKGLGTAMGSVYSANTLGGVLGSFAAGFLLIPALGVHNAILLVGALNAGMGVMLTLSEPRMSSRRRWAMASAPGLAFAGLAVFLMTRGAAPLASYYERMEAATVLSYEEGVGSTVKVFMDRDGEKLLSIDGFPVAGTTLGMHDAQQSLAQIPLLVSPVPSPRVNIIGFGTGGTSWGILQHGVERIDCVELVSGVIRAARWFPEVNHGVLEDPRYHVIMGDGRNYALMATEIYDVISIDATSPKMAGNGSLYSLEFYRLLRERLSEDGMVVQWLPIHLLSDAEVRMTARTFQTVFPHSTLWLSPLRHHGVLVGTRKPLAIDYRVLRAKMEKEGVRAELARFNVTDPLDFLAWFVMGEEALARYGEGSLMNTDDHPYLEFSPAMAFFTAQEYQVRNLARLRDNRETPASLLTNLGDTEEERAVVLEAVERRFQATQHSITGDVFFALGREAEAREAYARARAIDPDDKNWMNPAWLLGVDGGG